MATIASFLSGLLFGVGLVISGLSNPQKVQNFLDLAGAFDPSLAVTMAVAVLLTGLGYRLVLARTRPVLAATFEVPTARAIDTRLAVGSALFGVGWGLAGFCPGPAVAASSIGSVAAITFLSAMITGMAIARAMPSAQPGKPAAA